MYLLTITSVKASPSSRRAWIEITLHTARKTCPTVALLAEGVDRNRTQQLATYAPPVALLAEGVDRNSSHAISSSSASVALLAEGVDRNSRRPSGLMYASIVALLAEGVDRNNALVQKLRDAKEGRPPRGGRG